MKLLEYAQKLKSKKYDPSHLRESRDKTLWPLSDRKLVLEVGCGVGLHPILFCKENPDLQLIACERTSEKFKKFLGRAQSHRLENLTPIHDEALLWLASQKEKSKAAFEKIFFLYPNPYPKNNQRNKRFLAMPSFQLYLECLKPFGEIELRTNEIFYFEEVQYLASEVWGLTIEFAGPLREGSPRGMTHFERKYLEREETCYEIILRRL